MDALGPERTSTAGLAVVDSGVAQVRVWRLTFDMSGRPQTAKPAVGLSAGWKGSTSPALSQQARKTVSVHLPFVPAALPGRNDRPPSDDRERRRTTRAKVPKVLLHFHTTC